MLKCYGLAGALLLLAGCQTNLQKLDPYSPHRQLQAVVEMSAGTRQLFRYEPGQHKFVPEQEAGHAWEIDFLPAPGNYGFVPGTLRDTARSGDGRPLDVLVLGAAEEQGKVLEVIPVAVLDLVEERMPELKIIAVPARPSERAIQATTFAELTDKYPAARKMVELWFQHYRGPSAVQIKGWRNEQAAEKEVRKWMK